ncbi:hypothetical protein Tco_0877593 [Tanacetum coccineum]|uniref:Uncharacterized protein n=1 Tax=Tanacetum coccineum TaxID=301880 RepID=A0ABQ5BYH5_9ASTR
MIGCKVMRTLASVEIEIMLILGLPCCHSSSSVRCLENVELPSVVPLPEDPYEAIRQAYLDGTDTESEPFEDPVETETPESPLTVAPPTSLPVSTSSTLVPILCRTARMAVRLPPAMPPGLSASMADVAAMSESVFLEDDEEEDDEEDEEIEESLDSDSVSEDTKDEGPTAEDEDPAAGNEGPSMGVESRGLDNGGHSVERDGLGLEEEEEAVPEGQQRAVSVVGATMSTPFGLGTGSGTELESERPERVSTSRQPTLTTWTDPEDGMVYIDVPAYPPPSLPVQTPPSPEWSSGSLPISLSPSIVPSPISSPMIPLTGGLIRDHAVRLEELSPALFERYDRDIGELFNRSKAVRDDIFSQRYRFRSLEHDQERVAVTFGALWRLVLALESWAGQTDAQRVALWHAISDAQGENRELQLQLAEERRARLELAEIVDSMRRGQEH